MKLEHALILKKLEEYFEQDGADKLRFWQGLYNAEVIREEKVDRGNYIDYVIKDDYNIKDSEILNNIKL